MYMVVNLAKNRSSFLEESKMYYVKANRITYQMFQESFPELRPDNQIELIQMDTNLELLGFIDCAPCVFSIDISKEDLEVLIEELAEMLEYVDCFIEGDKIEDQQYQHCIKYGWMYNYLKQALKSE